MELPLQQLEILNIEKVGNNQAIGLPKWAY